MIMKKKLLLFSMVLLISFALVIPKTYAFGVFDDEYDSIYYAPFEYSIKAYYSGGGGSVYGTNFESITFPNESVLRSVQPNVNFDSNFYYEETFADSSDHIYNWDYGIYPYSNYQYYYSARFVTYGDPSFFNISMNIPMFVLNEKISNEFVIQYYDTYCNVNEIEVDIDFRYVKEGNVYNANEVINLIDSTDSDSLSYKPLNYTYFNLYNKYGVTEFVVSRFDLTMNMNSDSQYYIISHPLYENGYGFEVPYVSVTEEVINPDFTSFIVNAVSGFMDFQIIPGVSFSAIFGLLIMIPVLLWILKFFFGG